MFANAAWEHPLIQVTATALVRRFGRYREVVQRETIAVSVHDRITGYFVSTQDFEELQRLKAMMPAALAVDELDQTTLQALADATMDKRHAGLDALMD